MTIVPTPLVVKVSEAAAMLGLSRSKLYPLISKGEIHRFKIGRSRRVPVKEIESLIERQVQLSREEYGFYVSAS